MKRLVLLLLAAALCSPAATKRILILGDSWAAGTWLSKAGDKALAAAGLGAYETEGEGTAIGGSRADQWAANQKGKLDAMHAALTKHPTIDIVHVYIGGNDFLRYALQHDLAKLTPAERKAQWTVICADTRKLINDILARRPNLKVVLVDYDHLDPARMAAVYKPTMPSAFFGISTRQFNEVLEEFGHARRDMIRQIPRTAYVENWGLLKEPLPDGVHPTPDGFQKVFANVIDKLYRNWLK